MHRREAGEQGLGGRWGGARKEGAGAGRRRFEGYGCTGCEESGRARWSWGGVVAGSAHSGPSTERTAGPAPVGKGRPREYARRLRARVGGARFTRSQRGRRGVSRSRLNLCSSLRPLAVRASRPVRSSPAMCSGPRPSHCQPACAPPSSSRFPAASRAPPPPSARPCRFLRPTLRARPPRFPSPFARAPPRHRSSLRIAAPFRPRRCDPAQV